MVLVEFTLVIFGLSFDPHFRLLLFEVIATIGSKEGLAHLAFATLAPGDTVLVPNPAYPIHPYGVVLAGADVRHVRLTPEVDFFEELQKAIKETMPAPAGFSRSGEMP